ncbi:hypothetical protein [Pseudoduganella lutea]|uniref:Carboxypeptidase regulatory-like domain-containing protein n=1 Tax=Pseudoduganella lutea TaxID=321985 RepID=A0A4P6KTM7_9BURK|nr:hypothetical protein [Pseudoduganella lutea]QBE61925.1 hypothetical protein EWM63_02065 [Pseudoduganella lutea]
MTTRSTILRGVLRASTLAILATLAACGGTEDPDIPFQSKPITVSGTVATSRAADATTTALNVPVTLDCRNGHGTAMSDASGNYTVTTTGLTSGPCVVTATIVSGTTATVLRSLAAGDGSRANVTPLTEMLTQYVWAQTGFVFPAGQSNYATQPGSALAELNRFRDLMANQVTLDASLGRVIAVAQASEAAPAVAIPADFLTGQLVARTASNPGNAQSKVMEDLRARPLAAPNAASNVIDAGGLPAAPLLALLHADARARLLP